MGPMQVGLAKYHKSGVHILNLGDDAGHLFEGGAYSFFPKSWPDMITFLIHHLHINNNISCLLLKS